MKVKAVVFYKNGALVTWPDGSQSFTTTGQGQLWAVNGVNVRIASPKQWDFVAKRELGERDHSVCLRHIRSFARHHRRHRCAGV